ncbi:hypothetical protein [Streptomyces griseorubiginosus]|uniref:hypothetical protein n=1 Tax=Streptomyces griseorubiginosus TaxID=67304 RepID=UPI0036EE9294
MTTGEQDQDTRGRGTYLSAAGLRARGWTAGMVRRLLGEPDLRRANPYFRTAPPTRLYSVERVEAVERSEEFKAVSSVAVRRSGAVREAVLRRRREVLARIAAEPIEVPVLAPEELAALAVEHRERQGGSPELPLAHWKVACLCHRLARYDDILDGLSGRTGRAAAEQLLRRRVYAAIAQAYPDLAQECADRSGPENQVRSGPPPPMIGKLPFVRPQEPT